METTSKRVIVVGDVHGCLTQLDELIRTIEYNPERDRLIFAGDLMDRGPDGVGVVRRVRELKAEAVMGNHDEKHVRFRRHENVRKATGKKNPMTFPPGRIAENEALSDEDIAWMAAMPRTIRLHPHRSIRRGDYRIVHAGIGNDSPPHEQGDQLLRLRYAHPDGKPYTGDNLNPPNDVVRWAQVYRGLEHVIYGHAVYDLQKVTIDEPHPGVYCYGIDTGCAFGGHLTAMIVDSLEFVQVKCPTRYARWRGEEELPPGVRFDENIA